MLRIVEGDIFDSGAEILVNPVNTQGTAGRGLPRRFKTKYPYNFRFYLFAHHMKNLSIGKILLFYRPSFIPEDYQSTTHYIANLPVKKNWQSPSSLDAIEKGLRDLVLHLEIIRPNSIALPALGCNVGELNWEREVKPLMLYYLEPFSETMDIQIFDPISSGRFIN